MACTCERPRLHAQLATSRKVAALLPQSTDTNLVSDPQLHHNLIYLPERGLLSLPTSLYRCQLQSHRTLQSLFPRKGVMTSPMRPRIAHMRNYAQDPHVKHSHARWEPYLRLTQAASVSHSRAQLQGGRCDAPQMHTTKRLLYWRASQSSSPPWRLEEYGGRALRPPPMSSACLFHIF